MLVTYPTRPKISLKFINNFLSYPASRKTPYVNAFTISFQAQNSPFLTNIFHRSLLAPTGLPSRNIAPLSVWLHLFCGAGREKRRGEQLKWSWYLGCTAEVFHVHNYQDQFIQPGWAECVFLIFSEVCILCIYLYCFNLFACPQPFVFPWAVESSSVTGFGAGVTNLNEPPRAFANSTIP